MVAFILPCGTDTLRGWLFENFGMGIAIDTAVRLCYTLNVERAVSLHRHSERSEESLCCLDETLRYRSG